MYYEHSYYTVRIYSDKKIHSTVQSKNQIQTKIFIYHFMNGLFNFSIHVSYGPDILNIGGAFGKVTAIVVEKVVSSSPTWYM